MPLGTQVFLAPGDIVLDPPHLLGHVYCGETVAHIRVRPTNYDIQFGVYCVGISVLNHYAILVSVLSE